MYDEEIHDILVSHRDRLVWVLVRVLVRVAVCGVAVYVVMAWYPSISLFASESLITIQKCAVKASTAAHQAIGTVAAVVHDGWNASE